MFVLLFCTVHWCNALTPQESFHLSGHVFVLMIVGLKFVVRRVCSVQKSVSQSVYKIASCYYLFWLREL